MTCNCENAFLSHLIQIFSQKRKIKQGKLGKKKKDDMLEPNEEEVVKNRFGFFVSNFLTVMLLQKCTV